MLSHRAPTKRQTDALDEHLPVSWVGLRSIDLDFEDANAHIQQNA